VANKKMKKPTAPVAAGKENFFRRHPLMVTALAAFLLLAIFYFPILFDGKVLLSPDKMTSQSFKPFVKDAFDRNIFPLWCPYIFGGMPSYASLLSAPRINIIDSPVRTILKVLQPLIPDTNFVFILINYILFAVLMYLLLRNHKVTPLVAMFAGLAVIFMPQFIAFTAYGHNTKFLSLMLIPLIFLLTERLFEKRNAFYFSLTALTIGYQLIRAHVQVCYYTYLLLGIYLLFKIVTDYRRSKKIGDILAPVGLLFGVIAVGALLSSVLYVSVFDYQRYSIRGASAGDGLDFNYATDWSFHPLEMITFIIPSFMGFGGQTYWGKMPFTDYPLYFSVLILLLAGLAFILRRDRFTWLFGATALISLLVSFGKHFPLLYTPMFKLLPFFNKFRIPSMIHILLDICMVILAGYGLNALLEYHQKAEASKKQKSPEKILKRYMAIFLGVIGVFALFVLLGKNVFMDLITSGSNNMDIAMRERAWEMAAGDSFKALLLAGLGSVLVFQFLKNKLSAQVIVIAFTALVVIDLWFIDFKLIQPQPAVDEKTYFADTPTTKFLKADKSLYRILPLRDDKSANWYMYHFISNINGYSAAKLRIYQEFLEETLYGGPLSNNVLNMLNVKYLLSLGAPIPDLDYKMAYSYAVMYGGQKISAFVYENLNVLPRVFFADTVEVLTGRRSIFDRMKSETFDPGQVAILEEYPPFTVAAVDSNTTATITDYDIHHITISAQVNKPAIMVLSEIYYPSGWKAYIDGIETHIYKTNYVLRSIFLEPGSHTIEFKFAPASFKLGLWISLVTLIILLAILGSTGYAMWRKSRKKSSNAV